MKRVAYIMRGLPGSGKSTLVQAIIKGSVWNENHSAVHSTDSYFMVNGEYKFELEKLKENHQKNFEAFKQSLEAGVEIVICDNTNTRKWEYERYVEMAKKYDYEIHVIIAGEFSPKVCVFRCKHGLTEEKIAEMAERFEL